MNKNSTRSERKLSSYSFSPKLIDKKRKYSYVQFGTQFSVNVMTQMNAHFQTRPKHPHIKFHQNPHQFISKG